MFCQFSKHTCILSKTIYRIREILYGIYNREKEMNPLDYCLISDETLQQLGTHYNYDTTVFYNNTITK